MFLIVNTVIFAHLFLLGSLDEVEEYNEVFPPSAVHCLSGRNYAVYPLACGNGVIIVHSHPFKGQHEHTEVQLETIFYLASFVSSSLPLLPVAATVFLVLLCVLSILTTECIKCVKLRGGICLRAPPSFFQIR